jgi:hypothetical protein
VVRFALRPLYLQGKNPLVLPVTMLPNVKHEQLLFVTNIELFSRHAITEGSF